VTWTDWQWVMHASWSSSLSTSWNDHATLYPWAANAHTQGFRAKLFLESFGIRAALLNAELPLNSRSHILASFNKGMFDYLIATGG
jgi:hypothetical protein